MRIKRNSNNMIKDCNTCGKQFDNNDCECHCICCWAENCPSCNCEDCCNKENERLKNRK